MKVLARQDFLQKLINTIHTPDIKVITGIRRSGKSKLLEKFAWWDKSIEEINELIPILTSGDLEMVRRELMVRK